LYGNLGLGMGRDMGMGRGYGFWFLGWHYSHTPKNGIRCEKCCVQSKPGEKMGKWVAETERETSVSAVSELRFVGSLYNKPRDMATRKNGSCCLTNGSCIPAEIYFWIWTQLVLEKVGKLYTSFTSDKYIMSFK